MPIALVTLAAGHGSRMQSDVPKVLHQIGHAPLLSHAIMSGLTLEPSRIIVVAGHGADAVEAALAEHHPEAQTVRQEPQLGTAHAVAQAAELLATFEGDVIVLYGDTPFVSAGTLEAMLAARATGADLVMLGFEAADPGRYGRLITQDDALLRIVEARDATPDELAVTLCNSGVVCASRAVLFDLVSAVGNDNAAGEYYLTDIVGLATARGLSARVVTCAEAETLGVNTRADLAAAEATFQEAARAAALEAGATLIAPETVFFAHDTHIGRDVLIEPNVVFGPGVTIETGAHIRAFSHLEGCHVSGDCVVGPYARLRPGAELDQGARIGNFVEIKEAQIGAGAKVNHLSYIGDADVGPDANIGAGTITCNYDGVNKHRTEIGARSFIGTNTALVAPVSIGADAMTAAGSVVTRDVPDGALGIARAKQVTKPGLARKLRDLALALKARGVS
jgi:bifunctional UDP-N-acetylglucosamine pyrophosphorylase/glucosamine-1-phosphate N-acetyltransferase